MWVCSLDRHLVLLSAPWPWLTDNQDLIHSTTLIFFFPLLPLANDFRKEEKSDCSLQVLHLYWMHTTCSALCQAPEIKKTQKTRPPPLWGWDKQGLKPESTGSMGWADNFERPKKGGDGLTVLPGGRTKIGRQVKESGEREKGTPGRSNSDA